MGKGALPIVCCEQKVLKMMTQVQLTVPPGLLAGQMLSFEDPEDGCVLQAPVPEGLKEGDRFHVEVAYSSGHAEVVCREPNPGQAFASYVSMRAQSGDLLDKFVAWVEAMDIEGLFSKFVQANAHLMQG